MTLLLVGILAGMAIGLALAVWPPRLSTAEAQSAFGTAVVTGAAISLAFFFLQKADQSKQDALSQRETLRLSIALQHDLRGADLSGRYLGDVDLAFKDLSQADLRGAELSDVSLVRVRLDGAVLDGAQLAHVDLSDASLRGAVLGGTDLQRAIFNRADLEGAAIGVDGDGRAADLRNAHFIDARLRGVCFAHADLRHALFGGADLRGAVFTGADLRGTEFEVDGVNANLAGAIGLRSAKLDPAARRRLVPRAPEAPVTPEPPPKAPEARVARVSDGDTFQLDDGRWVRLIGLDAPRSGDPQGQASKRFLEQVLRRGTIRYVLGDPPAETFRTLNPPGRLRAYVWLSDGRFVNETLLAGGYVQRVVQQRAARPDTGAIRRSLDAAARRAQDQGLRIWSRCRHSGTAT